MGLRFEDSMLRDWRKVGDSEQSMTVADNFPLEESEFVWLLTNHDSAVLVLLVGSHYIQNWWECGVAPCNKSLHLYIGFEYHDRQCFTLPLFFNNTLLCQIFVVEMIEQFSYVSRGMLFDRWRCLVILEGEPHDRLLPVSFRIQQSLLLPPIWYKSRSFDYGGLECDPQGWRFSFLATPLYGGVDPFRGKLVRGA